MGKDIQQFNVGDLVIANTRGSLYGDLDNCIGMVIEVHHSAVWARDVVIGYTILGNGRKYRFSTSSAWSMLSHVHEASSVV